MTMARWAVGDYDSFIIYDLDEKNKRLPIPGKCPFRLRGKLLYYNMTYYHLAPWNASLRVAGEFTEIQKRTRVSEIPNT